MEIVDLPNLKMVIFHGDVFYYQRAWGSFQGDLENGEFTELT
jgi:hypothetical protein